jgi:hypothetical protein
MVAMAAPLAPQPTVVMRMGSRMILMTVPPMLPIMDWVAMPSQRTRLEWIKFSTVAGAPMASTV